MKRCPECRRDYYDDRLLYCLEDGTALVQGSVPSPDEPQTAILPGGVAVAWGDATAIVRSAEIIAPEATANSIAVLPFVHLSSEPDDEFFCDGLAEELINALTKLESLRVAARTSTFSFKGTNAKVNEIDGRDVATVYAGPGENDNVSSGWKRTSRATTCSRSSCEWRSRSSRSAATRVSRT
jgi:hypothetical protein